MAVIVGLASKFVSKNKQFLETNYDANPTITDTDFTCYVTQIIYISNALLPSLGCYSKLNFDSKLYKLFQTLTIYF